MLLLQHRNLPVCVISQRELLYNLSVQAFCEQSEGLRALRTAIGEAKAAMQRQQQEQDLQLLKVFPQAPLVNTSQSYDKC
jgi:hypothetical protein